MGREGRKLLKIGELAEKAGVTVRTVRYYEELGLLVPSETSPGGFRLYTEDDLRLLSYIKRFKALDFPLEVIKELLDKGISRDDKEHRIAASIALLERQLRRVEDKIGELDNVRTEIKEAINALRECRACEKETCLLSCPNRAAML